MIEAAAEEVSAAIAEKAATEDSLLKEGKSIYLECTDRIITRYSICLRQGNDIYKWDNRKNRNWDCKCSLYFSVMRSEHLFRAIE